MSCLIFRHSEKHREKCREREPEQKTESESENTQNTNLYSEIDRLVQSFMGMLPNQYKCPMNQETKETKEAKDARMETEESSQDEDVIEIIDGPEPVKLDDDDEVNLERPSTSENATKSNGATAKNTSKKRVFFNILPENKMSEGNAASGPKSQSKLFFNLSKLKVSICL